MNPVENNSIDILLSTYNGSKYLQELLDSIFKQIHQNWKLLIRDDGSMDDTVNIIQKFERQFPDKITFIDDQHNHLGPSQSFSKLMEYSDADYIMFCDQDDIWLENKIEITLKKMLQLENEFLNKPLLVHTDLIVVNKDLQVISNSFWKYQMLNPELKDLNYLMIQNIATGCTMMMNRILKDLSYPVPSQAIMHDWWISLVATIYSGIHRVNDSTILYRQHSENNIGAKRYSLKYFLNHIEQVNESVMKIIIQGEIFFQRYKDILNKQQFKITERFIHLFHKNRFKRMIDIFLFRFRKHGLLRNIGFMITTLFFNRNKIK